MKFKYHPTQAYIKDTGLVVVLVLLLMAYWTGNSFLLPLAIGILLVVMTVPTLLKPLAFIWYYFSITFGKMTNRIILTVIFVGILVPVGVVRRCLGFDPMKRKAWKNGVTSVLTERNHLYSADDFNRPF